MKQLYKIGIIIVLASTAMGAFGATHQGPRTRIERTINREFKTNSTPQIRLNTQKGQIKFRTWNENRILIRITIASEADTKSQAENGLDMVHVITKNSDNVLIIETDFENEQSDHSFWNLIRFWEDNLKLTVDMVINVPINTTYDLKHKYGDLIIPNAQKAKIDIRYGSVNGGHFRDHLDLVAHYSKGTLGDLEHSDLQLHYSDFDIGNNKSGTANIEYSKYHSLISDKIIMDSKYSSVSIGSVDDLIFNGKFDKIKIGNTDKVNITTKYTAIAIDALYTYADITNSYQSTKIHNVHSDFENLQLQGRYGNIEISFDGTPDALFNLSTKYGKIQVPADAVITTQDDADMIRVLEGCLGECEKPISVNNSYGNITIEYR